MPEEKYNAYALQEVLMLNTPPEEPKEAYKRRIDGTLRQEPYIPRTC